MITAVMIDAREPDYFKSLTFGGVPCVVAQLPCGDVQAMTDDGYTLIFERKTLSDLLGSIADGRIMNQCAKMREVPDMQQRTGAVVTQYCYLVITEPITCSRGKVIDPMRGVTGWHYASVQGALLSIQEMGVYIVFCDGQQDYEKTILTIGKRNRSPETYITAMRPARMLGPKIDFLCGLPGIGVEKAQEILAWAGDNLAHAITGLTDLEIKTPIGMTHKRKLRDMLGLQETETLQVHGTEILEPIVQGKA